MEASEEGRAGEPPRTLGDFREREGAVVTIDGYGFTGEGYHRLEDGWISVRGALPGERVRVRLQPGQRPGARRLYADLVEVLEASEVRGPARCAWDRFCRGCHLRHAVLDEERRYKIDSVAEIFERYAGLSDQERPTIEWIGARGGSDLGEGEGMRVRSRAHYRRRGGCVELGLISPGCEALVPMAVCPALAPGVRELLAEVRRVLERELPPDAHSVAEGAAHLSSVRAMRSETGRGYVVLEWAGGTPQEVDEMAAPILEALVAASGSGERGSGPIGWFWEHERRLEHAGGPRRARTRVIDAGLLGGDVWVGPGCWSHATEAPARALYRALALWMAPLEGMRALDVGCGVGTIALLAARRGARALGIDANRRSIEMARYNAGRAEGSIADEVEFRAAGFEKGLRDLRIEGRSFDVATINPMRAPVGERALVYLDELGVERAVYLGPSPVSAAKDVGVMRERGWEVARLGVVDLHPETYHTMALVGLRREPGPRA